MHVPSMEPARLEESQQSDDQHSVSADCHEDTVAGRMHVTPAGEVAESWSDAIWFLNSFRHFGLLPGAHSGGGGAQPFSRQLSCLRLRLARSVAEHAVCAWCLGMQW